MTPTPRVAVALAALSVLFLVVPAELPLFAALALAVALVVDAWWARRVSGRATRRAHDARSRRSQLVQPARRRGSATRCACASRCRPTCGSSRRARRKASSTESSLARRRGRHALPAGRRAPARPARARAPGRTASRRPPSVARLSRPAGGATAGVVACARAASATKGCGAAGRSASAPSSSRCATTRPTTTSARSTGAPPRVSAGR